MAGVAVGSLLLAVLATLVCVALIMRRRYARQRGGSRRQRQSYDGRAASAPRETSFWARLMRSGSSRSSASCNGSVHSSGGSSSGGGHAGPMPHRRRNGAGAQGEQSGSARSTTAERLTSSRLKDGLSGKVITHAPGAGGGAAVTLVATDVEGRCVLLAVAGSGRDSAAASGGWYMRLAFSIDSGVNRAGGRQLGVNVCGAPPRAGLACVTRHGLVVSPGLPERTASAGCCPPRDLTHSLFLSWTAANPTPPALHVRSTELWEWQPDVMNHALALHDRLMRLTLAACCGYEVREARTHAGCCGRITFIAVL